MKTSSIFNNVQKVKLNLLIYSEKEVEVTNSSKRKGWGGGVIMILVFNIEASRGQRQEWL